MCDVTVLVLRANRSTRKAAEQAAEALQSVGAKVLGVVVNDADPRRGGYESYGYYGYYGYGNGRGKGEQARAPEAEAEDLTINRV